MESEMTAIKNIRSAMDGTDNDEVLVLTDVYHDDAGHIDINSQSHKHKEVLENINDTLEFINSTDTETAAFDAENVKPVLMQSSEIRDSLNKLKDVKSLYSNQNVKENVSEIKNQSTVEELVIQLIKPQLELWLNNHLATIVEKEVRSAIEKIVQDS